MNRTKPIVCSLSYVERVGRATTWRGVMRKYTAAVAELRDGYALTLNTDRKALERINGLVESERRCCEWMDLTLEPGEPVTLTITSASDGAKSVIAEMLGL